MQEPLDQVAWLDMSQNLEVRMEDKNTTLIFIYHELISLLSFLEVIIQDPTHFKYVRKKILDAANEVIRLSENDGR